MPPRSPPRLDAAYVSGREKEKTAMVGRYYTTYIALGPGAAGRCLHTGYVIQKEREERSVMQR